MPAYVIALPARILGISASTAFIVLIAAAALFASMCVFWLLRFVTGDDRFASAGTLFVLCLGCIVGRNGVFGTFLDIGPAAFPFLRRYQPAVAFPLFFAFQSLVWCALRSRRKRSALSCALFGGLTLVVLIFSHLYLWTATAAWLGCIGMLWFYFRPSDRRRMLVVLTTVYGLVAIALVPYVYLLSHRASTLDEQQILIATHRPDLFRLHEILGAAILIALVIGILRQKIERAEPRVLYAASLALLPFIVFNQQVLTGRTMQAFHFEMGVVNYSTPLGLLITLILLLGPLPHRLLLWMGGLSLLVGIIVVGLPARLIFVPQTIANDRSIPVLLRLKELSKLDGTLANLSTPGHTSPLVFSPNVALIALLPTWTSQGTLLDMTGIDCRGIAREEYKRMFFMHLYYSKTDIESLRGALNGTPNKSRDELSSVRTAVFGYERTSPPLTPEFRPIQPIEIEREMQNYQAFANSFSRDEALKRPIGYAVIPNEKDFD
ncbi:MAG: hypothetical protein ACMG6H_17410, partial [Acidobacteriota bacterium]